MQKTFTTNQNLLHLETLIFGQNTGFFVWIRHFTLNHRLTVFILHESFHIYNLFIWDVACKSIWYYRLNKDNESFWTSYDREKKLFELQSPTNTYRLDSDTIRQHWFHSPDWWLNAILHRSAMISYPLYKLNIYQRALYCSHPFFEYKCVAAQLSVVQFDVDVVAAVLVRSIVRLLCIKKIWVY